MVWPAIDELAFAIPFAGEGKSVGACGEGLLRVSLYYGNGECNECEQSSDPHVSNVSCAVCRESWSAVERS